MTGRTLFVIASLFLAAGVARAQGGTAAAWSSWQPATGTDGKAIANIEYRWRKTDPHCVTDCHMELQLRSNRDAETRVQYSIYALYSDVPTPHHIEVKPLTGDATLEPSGEARTSTESSNAALTLAVNGGASIARVTVELKGSATDASAHTFGPYHYELLFAGNDLTPDATMSVTETLRMANGVLTITEVRDAASVDPVRTPGLGTFTHTCTPQSARVSGSRIDDGVGEPYIPAPLWEVQLTCAEGPASALFLSKKEANGFVQSIDNARKP